MKNFIQIIFSDALEHGNILTKIKKNRRKVSFSTHLFVEVENSN